MGAKDPGGHVLAQLTLQRLHECRESGRSHLRRGRSAVGGPSSLACRRVQRELAYREQLASDVTERTVHHPRIVIEDA